jgi:ATP-binding cassette subfamily F protein 3
LARRHAKPEDFAELGRRLAHVNAEVAMLEERWLEAQTELEALQGQN